MTSASASSKAPRTAKASKPKGKPRGKPIQKGQVLNPKGRPPGSRNKLAEDFVKALSADFDEHGAAAIIAVRETKPEVYVRVVSDLVPKNVKLEHDASDTFLNIWKTMNGMTDD